MDAVYTNNFADFADGPLVIHNYNEAQAGLGSPGIAYGEDYLKIKFFERWAGSPNTIFVSTFCYPVGSLSLSEYRLETYVNNIPRYNLFCGTGQKILIFKFWTSTVQALPYVP